MGTIQKRPGARGVRYRVQIRHKGRGTVSRTFRTHAEAKAWEAEQESGGTAAAGRHTLKDAFDKFDREVVPHRAGGRWESLRLSAWGRTEWAGKRLSRVVQADIATWRDARLLAVSGASVAREMNLLSTVLETARREWGWIGANPCRGVKRPKEPPARRRGITQAEIGRIVLALGFDGKVATLSDQVAVAFLLALETAMRAGELLGLEWALVDLKRRVAKLPRTKNGDAREVALSRRAVQLLKLLKGQSRPFTVTPESRDALFRKARDAAGVGDLTFHDSRGEAITRLSKKLDVLELARMIGHRDLKSLMSYYHASAEDMAKKL